MARTLEAILKATTSGFDAAVDASAAKMAKLGTAAQAAGAKIDSGLAKGGKSAATLGSSVARGGATAAAGLEKATAATSKFGKSGSGIAKNADHLNRLSRTAGLAGAAIFAGLGVAVKATAEFDQAMSHVAATGADFSAKLGDLRGAAIQAGAATVFSAKEAANAEEELAKAGVSAQDVLSGGLTGALDLAAAGSLGVADAANIAATAMVQFGLKGANVPHIADLLAAGAGKAQGSVQDLGLALTYVGPVAHSMGVSIEQTTGVLAQFANAGLVGEKGGTALRGVLLSLTSPSRLASKTFQELGINLYDSQGRFVGVNGAAAALQKGLTGLTEAQRNVALGQIFGNAQITGATILYKGGAASVNEWTKKVNDSGFAARTAATKLNNLKGDVEQLSGSLQTAFISAGEGATGGLRGLVQGATGAVNAFNDLSPATRNAGTAIAAIAGAGLLTVAGIAKVAVGVSEARTAMGALRTDSPRLAGALGAVGKAAGVATAAIIALEIAGAAAKAFHGVLTPNVEEASRALSSLTKTGNALDLNKMFTITDKGSFGQAIVDTDSLGTAFQRLSHASFGDKVNQQIDTMLGTTETTLTQLTVKFSALDQSLIGLSSAGHADQAAAQFKKVADAAALQGFPVDKLIKLFPQYAQAVGSAATSAGTANLAGQALADAMGGKLTPALQKALVASGALPKTFDAGAAAVGNFATAMLALTQPMQLTSDQSKSLSQSLFAEGNAFQDSVSSHSAYAASLDSAGKALSGHSLSINKNTGYLADNTQKQRDAGDALNTIASSGKAYVQSLVAQGAGSKQAAAATQAVRDQFVKTADAAGLTARQANKLADSYGLVPKDVSTTFQTFGLALQAAQVKAYGDRILALPKEQQARILSIYNDKGSKAALAELNKLDHTKATPTVAPNTAKAIAAAKQTEALFVRLGRIVAHPNIKTESNAKRVADAASAALKAIRDKHPKVVTEKDLRNAQNAVGYLKAIRDKHPNVVTEKDLRNAQAAVSYLRGIRDAHPRITVSSNAASVAGSAQRAITSIRGKTVFVTVRTVNGPTKTTATGGLVTDAGVLYRSYGGPVWGAGTATSDSIDAKLSNGEYVQKTAAVDKYGVSFMQALNNLRVDPKALPAYRAGGPVGANHLATGGQPQSIFYGEHAYQVSLNTLLTIDKKIAALNDPLASVAGNFRQVNLATQGVAVAQRNLTAVQRRAGHTADQVTKSQDLLKAAQDRLVQSNDNLGVAQASLADAARSVSATLRQSADTTSTDPLDVLAKRKESAASLAAFNRQLLALRKAGLNDQDLADIVNRGALDGAEIAGAILKGGKGLIGALNTAEKNLQHAADSVGITTSVGVIRRAGGGWVDGPSGDDKIRALLTRREFVVNDKSATANAGLVQAINSSGGRNITADLVRGFQTFGGYDSSGGSTDSHNVHMPITVERMGSTDQQLLNQLQFRLRSSLVAAGIV